MLHNNHRFFDQLIIFSWFTLIFCKTFTFGHNINLVFNSALNVVQLLEPLLFVNVVQLLLRPKIAKMGCSGKKIMAAQTNQNQSVVSQIHKLIAFCGEHLRCQFSCHFGPKIRAKIGSLGVSKAPGGLIVVQRA